MPSKHLPWVRFPVGAGELLFLCKIRHTSSTTNLNFIAVDTNRIKRKMKTTAIQFLVTSILSLTAVDGFTSPKAFNKMLIKKSILKTAMNAKSNAMENEAPVCTSRRNAIQTTVFGMFFLTTSTQAANAIDACPKGSKNCLRQAWTPPTSEGAISQLRDIIQSYPQAGQNDVDGGGYTIISDDLEGSTGVLKVEYRSSGKGSAAKFFNGGKPFVDDLIVEMDAKDADNVMFQVRSSSRVGDSDFGVNQKRLSYLFGGLKALGWKGKGLAN